MEDGHILRAFGSRWALLVVETQNEDMQELAGYQCPRGQLSVPPHVHAWGVGKEERSFTVSRGKLNLRSRIRSLSCSGRFRSFQQNAAQSSERTRSAPTHQPRLVSQKGSYEAGAVGRLLLIHSGNIYPCAGSCGVLKVSDGKSLPWGA